MCQVRRVLEGHLQLFVLGELPLFPQQALLRILHTCFTFLSCYNKIIVTSAAQLTSIFKLKHNSSPWGFGVLGFWGFGAN